MLGLQGGGSAMRDAVFLSHANPEDNDFTLWLALQLAQHGYRVWSDLTDLLGGEDFWRDAEKAIRERAAKVVFVLSRTSNTKVGPLRELQVATNVARAEELQDFVIPALIDDLPHHEINIQLARIAAIPCRCWEPGLKALLGKLEKDHVPRDPVFSPTSVASWWRSNHSSKQGLLNNPEEYLSNWFPIQGIPSEMYLHVLKQSGMGLFAVPDDLPYPAFAHGRLLVSFAPARDFAGFLGPALSIEESHSVPTEGPIDNVPVLSSLNIQKRRDFAVQLLRLAWDNMLDRRRLPSYQLADKMICHYFVKGTVQRDSISFAGVVGKPSRRQVVGRTKSHYWHFGVTAKPILHPSPIYVVKSHVLFSNDGIRIWESKHRLHTSRRSLCRNWWNSEWRDRLLATMAWLSDATGIDIPLGQELRLLVPSDPFKFESPVSYCDPTKAPAAEFSDYGHEDIDEDDSDAEPSRTS